MIFTKAQMGAFADLRAAVERALAARHDSQPPRQPAAPVSIADELAKLAALTQQGILTPQEFEAQKARLLTGGL